MHFTIKLATLIHDAVQASPGLYLNFVKYPRVVRTPAYTELVFAVVAAIGTDLESFSSALKDHLAKFGYDTKEHRLSQFITDAVHEGILLHEAPESARLNSYIDAGNCLRERSERPDIMAMYAIWEIQKNRQGEAPEGSKFAYYLRSLKRPEEVQLLRSVYGSAFYLIGLYATESERMGFLTEDKDVAVADAQALNARDEDENVTHGQRTRDTYQLADVFIRQGPEMKEQLWRFLDLVFGAPFCTPTVNENAMYTAFVSSLRSADLSRQVGAVITTESGDLIGTGCNDVARFGGGLYWGEGKKHGASGDSDKRDYALGHDCNEIRKREIVKDLIENPPFGDLLSGTKKDKLRNSEFKGRLIFDITEYGRPVHAEMEAVLCCARNGIPTKGCWLYTTTFPCHNCAKHIVCAGISKVLYVEPYPKSMAKRLYFDSISIGIEEESRDKRLCFEPFIGIGARRYVDLFAMDWSAGYNVRRKEKGIAVEWPRSNAAPRVPMLPTSYLEREEVVAADLLKFLEHQSED